MEFCDLSRAFKVRSVAVERCQTSNRQLNSMIHQSLARELVICASSLVTLFLPRPLHCVLNVQYNLLLSRDSSELSIL